jgi:hypothetical protein
MTGSAEPRATTGHSRTVGSILGPGSTIKNIERCILALEYQAEMPVSVCSSVAKRCRLTGYRAEVTEDEEKAQRHTKVRLEGVETVKALARRARARVARVATANIFELDSEVIKEDFRRNERQV